MNRIKLLAFALILGTTATAQKTQTFEIERNIDAPAEAVWKVVGEEFAEIAKSHPKLAGSHYVEGSPLSGEGCERICNFSDDGSKYTKEKIVDYNPAAYSFRSEINAIGGLPLEPGLSYMIYDIDLIDATHSRIKLRMVYRTNPAIMGALAKGKFKKNIADYAIAIEHYTLTQEEVNPENFKRIKKAYL